MRKYKIVYSDRENIRNERYETNPYPGPVAHDLARQLEQMGCCDFEFVPVKDRT